MDIIHFNVTEKNIIYKEIKEMLFRHIYKCFAENVNTYYFAKFTIIANKKA